MRNVMRITLALLLAIALTSSARAQNWTPAEQEVIDFIVNCQAMWAEADYDVWFDACWDENIIYVDPSDAPTSKINRDLTRKVRPYARAGIMESYSNMTPISVKVYGDTAVIYYHIRAVRIDRDGNVTSPWNGLSSETVIKRDGK
jgi:ketosteroid isomerase-like protein